MPGLRLMKSGCHKLQTIAFRKSCVMHPQDLLHIRTLHMFLVWHQIHLFNASTVGFNFLVIVYHKLSQYGDFDLLGPDNISYLLPHTYMYMYCTFIYVTFFLVYSLCFRIVLSFAKASSWYSLCIHWQANESKAQVMFYLFAYLLYLIQQRMP